MGNILKKTLTKIIEFFKRSSTQPKPKGSNMIKNLTELEMKIGERVYKLLCACDSPLGEVHDVLNSMKAHVLKVMQDSVPKEDPKEEPKDVSQQ